MLKAGNGDSILFWHDKWCEGGTLKAQFPCLFSISSQQDCFIKQMGYWHGGSWKWILSWRRLLYDWELEDFLRLENIIDRITPSLGAPDDICWRDSNIRDYPFRTIVDKIYESCEPILPPTSVRSLWHICAPPRARLTVWFALLGKLKTGDLLVEKGILETQ